MNSCVPPFEAWVLGCQVCSTLAAMGVAVDLQSVACNPQFKLVSPTINVGELMLLPYAAILKCGIAHMIMSGEHDHFFTWQFELNLLFTVAQLLLVWSNWQFVQHDFSIVSPTQTVTCLIHQKSHYCLHHPQSPTLICQTITYGRLQGSPRILQSQHALLHIGKYVKSISLIESEWQNKGNHAGFSISVYI